jgi:hypothetical protein
VCLYHAVDIRRWAPEINHGGRSYPAAAARASIEPPRAVTAGDMPLLIAGSIDAVIRCE